MRFDTSQQMRLGQHMKLAPRMIQSMEILQMPMLALQERIEQELESNIALEQIEPTGDEDEQKEAAEAEVRGEDGEREMVVGDENADDWERLSDLESNYREATDNEYSSQTYSPSRHGGERDRKMDAMANLAARGESLVEQLLHQWHFAEVDPQASAAGALIIEALNADGLLATSLADLLEQHAHRPGLELDLPILERSLREVQFWLDPPGVAARDVPECLLLQVDALASLPDAEDWSDVRRLIEKHFDDLLQNRLPRIAREADMPIERVQHAVEMMRRLKLNPGRDLVDDDVPPIIPDVVVEFDEDADVYVAALADGILPALRVTPKYRQMAGDRSVEKPTRDFVGQAVRNATWIIDAIRQRENTLLRVVNVVLTRQRDYFDRGSQFLKPLPMIEVADQLGVHVATVSRAVADKWLQTPRGMIALRKFFSGGTETDSGRDMSWEAVKATLKEIIDVEDKTKPLSDEALSAELKKRGIEIARRTVVKYRQQLDIPPARRRKVFVG